MAEKMKNRSIPIIISIFIIVLISASDLFAAAPKVTRMQLGANVGNGYMVIPSSTATAGSTYPMTPARYIAAGSSDSNDITDGNTAIANAFGAGQDAVQGDASFFGDSNGYGLFLFNITTGAATGTQTDRRLAEIRKWRVKNSNTTMMGGEQYGPGNISCVSLNNAIAEGTSVTLTIDMQGNKPHLIAIFGGTPTVTYTSAGNGTLTVQSSTVTTKNAGGRGGTDSDNQATGADTTDNTITSAFGMMIMTNDTIFGNPASAMKLVAWTNAWPGDIFAYAPGSDSNSNRGSGSAGTFGGSSAKMGLTVNGPTGDNRTFYMFVPSGTIETIFGTGVTSGDLIGYVNGSQASTTATSDSSTYTADGSAVTGVRLSFNYTFASATDSGVGVRTSIADTGGGIGGGGCFIATSAFDSYKSPYVWLLREFRFHYLMTNKIGKTLVSLYEKVSPSIAEFIDRHEFLKPAVRAAIMPSVWFSAFMFKTPFKIKLLSILIILIVSIIAGYFIFRIKR
ncbi:MAG: CFI-box-CTERM domain-containing protein [Nitrospirota bacterium]